MNLGSLLAQIQVPSLGGNGPITGLTNWIHTSMIQAGSDLTGPCIIVGALMGMFKGWLGMLAGGILGCVVAIFVSNADNIRNWAHNVNLG